MQVGKTDKTLDANTATLAEQALASILATDKFECSPQMTAFLRYVVNQTIGGHQSRIKAFSVAVDALGKPNSFDPQNDPVVRVLAGRLRTALDVYANEHPDVPLVISMKKGSYIPIFSGPGIGSDVENTTDTKQNMNLQAKTGEDIVGSENLVKQNASVTSNFTGSSSPNSGSNNSLTQESTQQNSTKAPWSFSTFLQSFRAYRYQWTIAALLLTVFGLVQVSEFKKNTGPQLRAALPTAEVIANYRKLAKPAEPCIYMSAVSSGNAFEDSLNTVVSGALANNKNIVVRRILSEDMNKQFWREDYILFLTAIELEEESRVNIQLLVATTGRVLHSAPIILKAHNTNHLSSSSLGTIITAAESLVAANGPLFQHFNADLDQQ